MQSSRSKRIRITSQFRRVSVGLAALFVALQANVARANWGENWGAMTWGSASIPVPGLDGWGLLLLPAVLVSVALLSIARRRGPRVTLVLLVALALPLTTYAATIVMPYVFVNGAPADAGEVNANFDTLVIESNAQDSRIITLESGVVHTHPGGDITSQVGDADTVDGAHALALEESAEIDADIATHAAAASAHHIRYADLEAQTAMGTKLNANPLNHDRYSDAEALVATAGTYVLRAGDTMTGPLGIGTAPAADLHGVGQNGLLFEGTQGLGSGVLPATGPGTRMLWYPEKAAFRAGKITGTGPLLGAEWDDANVGLYSVATGANTTASGNYSTAMGVATTASGLYSTAMGGYTTASGSYSTAMGDSTVASGNYSTAMGIRPTASGNYSTAMGGSTTASGLFSTAMGASTAAEAYSEVAIGANNTLAAIPSPGTWVSTDRLFTIGNGTSPLFRRDAMVVLKNGDIGIGTSTPTAKLQVSGRIRVSGSDILMDNDRYYSALDSTGTVRSMLGKSANDETVLGTASGENIVFKDGGVANMTIDGSSGNVGIGTSSPTAKLSVNGTANKPGGGSWAVFSDERLKEIGGNYGHGLDELMKLQPVVYHYKKGNALDLPHEPEYYGFSAQALQKVIPEAVSESASGYLEVHSDPVLWAMLNAIKQLKQQKDAEIAQLRSEKDAEIAALRAELSRVKAASAERMAAIESRLGMIARAMPATQMAKAD